MPAVEGLSVDQAVAQLEADGFRTSVATEASDAPSGTRRSRRTRPPERRPTRARRWRIRVSGGPDTIAVPNAVGLPEAEARDRLVGAGFQVESNEVFAEREPGTVTAQSPSAGAEAERGATVTIERLEGHRPRGGAERRRDDAGQAEAELSNARLEANVVEVPSDEPVGTVVAQNPVGGQAQQGTAIRLNVSAGR